MSNGNKFKTILIIISLICSFYLLFSFNLDFALSETIDIGLSYGEQTGLGAEDVRITIAKIIRVVLGILGIVFVLLIIYAGTLYMGSKGDPEKLDSVRKIFISAIIGLAIILASYSLASYILSKLLQATGVEIVGNGESINQNINNGWPDGSDEADGEDGGLPYIDEKNKIDSFVLNYNGQHIQTDSFDFAKEVLDFYDHRLASTHIYNLDDYDGVFQQALKNNRTISFIYTDTSNPESLKYYWINIHGRYGSISGGGKYDGWIAGIEADDCYFLDDPTHVTDYCREEGDKIVYGNTWFSSRTDGEIIYLGDGLEELDFTVSVDSFVLNNNLQPEWWFFSPLNLDGILLATEFPASVEINFQPN